MCDARFPKIIAARSKALQRRRAGPKRGTREAVSPPCEASLPPRVRGGGPDRCHPAPGSVPPEVTQGPHDAGASKLGPGPALPLASRGQAPCLIAGQAKPPGEPAPDRPEGQSPGRPRGAQTLCPLLYGVPYSMPRRASDFALSRENHLEPAVPRGVRTARLKSHGAEWCPEGFKPRA